MCKVFAMTNVSQVKMNAKFISTVRNEVCRHADQDGFGYALLSKKGAIGGERTMRPLNFRPLIDPEAPKTTKELPIVLNANNSFGKIDLVNPKSFIAHGRLSTNTISLLNTHPFTNGEMALIHNGVVRDPTSSLKNLISTCDSEILLRYWERGQMEAVEKMITGYYAVAILDKHGLLHIFRDDRAELYISWCKTVDSFIIATTPEIIKNVAKEMKWKVEHPEEILEKTYTVFDMNNILSHRSITPRTSDYSGTSSYEYGHGWKGNGYSTIENGKKNSSTTTNSDSSSSSSKTPGLEEGSGFHDYHGFGESDPTHEAVPKYRELPGKVATDSSSALATTSYDTTDQGNEIQSISESGEKQGDSNIGYDDRISAIVTEIEDFRNSRVGNGEI